MACPTRLSLWTREVSRAFTHLSKPQIWGLVLWSAGIAWSGCAGIVQISALLAMVLGQQEQSVLQRLREWYLDAETKGGKRGKKRRELEVSLCFAPLLLLSCCSCGKASRSTWPWSWMRRRWESGGRFWREAGC